MQTKISLSRLSLKEADFMPSVWIFLNISSDPALIVS